ncbi:CrcB-like protein-domain-containing protein [Xylaria sp. CBS 124048]|nr:CrcB-like protein-domain-containing protein [Xylaria sp. CBS 124048]
MLSSSEAAGPGPLSVHNSAPSRDQHIGELESRSGPIRPTSSSSYQPPEAGPDYVVPESYLSLPEVEDAPAIQDWNELSRLDRRSIKHLASRLQAGDEEIPQPLAKRQQDAPLSLQPPEGAEARTAVSERTTEFYTVSYLILFAIFGTLARLGLQALTFYPAAPIAFSSIWPNFAGCFIIGFLTEDCVLFRYQWGSPHQRGQFTSQKNDEESNPPDSQSFTQDPAAAKKAHLAIKKTIPLYIGLATGFCGSFTSFSSFMRDAFLALSNELPIPNAGPMSRNGGYSFMSLLAVLVGTLSLSFSGFYLGCQLADVLEHMIPSLRYPLSRSVVDPLAAVLAWGCWLGAIVLSIVPPDRHSNPGASEFWRGRATFALVFAPLGCLLRFYLSADLNSRIASFPLGTFAVNMAGTAVLGLTWDLAHVPKGGVIGCQVLQGIEDGFCGCLTTVSTWVLELEVARRRRAYMYGSVSVITALLLLIAIMGGLLWSRGFSDLLCVH